MKPITSDKPACRFCGCTELHETIGPIFRCGAYYSVLYCRRCSIGMTWPQPDVATLEELYAPGQYRVDGGKRFIAPVELLFEQHKKGLIPRFSSNMKPGSMLDVGCGSGFLASLFAQAGWTVTGVEFNDETAVHARETYNISVVTDISYVTGYFDLIVVNHVLEHHFEPELLLKECLRLLNPAGRLIVAVPNFSSFQSRIGSKNWFHLDFPTHLYHFTDQGLVNLLIKSGFTVINRSNADWVQNFYGWLQTLLNLVGLDHNALYNFLRMKHRAKKWPSAAIILSLFSCLWAIPTSLLGMFVERLFRTGGVIRCTAVPDQSHQQGSNNADNRTTP